MLKDLTKKKGKNKKKGMRGRLPDTLKIDQDTMIEKIKLDYLNDRGISLQYYEEKFFDDNYNSYRKFFDSSQAQESGNPEEKHGSKIKRTIDKAKSLVSKNLTLDQVQEDPKRQN